MTGRSHTGTPLRSLPFPSRLAGLQGRGMCAVAVRTRDHFELRAGYRGELDQARPPEQLRRQRRQEFALTALDPWPHKDKADIAECHSLAG